MRKTKIYTYYSMKKPYLKKWSIGRDSLTEPAKIDYMCQQVKNRKEDCCRFLHAPHPCKWPLQVPIIFSVQTYIVLNCFWLYSIYLSMVYCKCLGNKPHLAKKLWYVQPLINEYLCCAPHTVIFAFIITSPLEDFLTQALRGLVCSNTQIWSKVYFYLSSLI